MEIKVPKKLIEVALPLDAINAAAAKEKSIRHGHPSTLHLWWARRPLAAARAVLFAQLVNDPGYERHLGRGVNKQKAEEERKRLFGIIERMVLWENTNNEAVLEEARQEIWKSWRETCHLNRSHPQAGELFNPERLPGFHDPFAGGGAIPLEAQRLGLEAWASDLNPVAVLINKGMIDNPPRFADRAPVGPTLSEVEQGHFSEREGWCGAQGLADDVRRYGRWMRDKAAHLIGHLYPQIEITEQMACKRPDLRAMIGQRLTVIAWLWARTVKSPNPAFSHVEVPLATSFMLNTKAEKEVYVEPVIEGDSYKFVVKVGQPSDTEAVKNGTKLGRGANFQCVLSKSPIESAHIYSEANAGRMGYRLMAIVAEGEHGRIYLSPTDQMEAVANQAAPEWQPKVSMPDNPRWFSPPLYGLRTYGDLFTPRQLVALGTFCNLVEEARQKVFADAVRAGWPDDGRGLEVGGSGATAYADAVALYLAFCVDKATLTNTTLATWQTAPDRLTQAYSRQAIAMTWDFAEANPLSDAGGGFALTSIAISKVLTRAPRNCPAGRAFQANAIDGLSSRHHIVSTDPPYYDNIGYADLSDYFYVWLRRCIRDVFKELLGGVTVPKEEELIASPQRHGTKKDSEAFFLSGMTKAIQGLVEKAHPAYPVTIYYAFKASETRQSETSSTGWETFLDAVLRAGFSITGTWPMRTELVGNLKKNVSALASSIVLVCRQRELNAPSISRRDFVRELNDTLPGALNDMLGSGEHSPVAPVDLSQAIIGPGMAIFSKYSAVLEANGQPMSVRTALQLINRFLAEEDFDRDTQFCLHWFEQQRWETGRFGEADVLARAKGTSVDGVREAGVLSAGRGEVRLLRIDELSQHWNPRSDARLPVWEALHHLVRTFRSCGEEAAGRLLARIVGKADAIRQLAYRLYTLCERKGWAEDARPYNELIAAWSHIEKQMQQAGTTAEQGEFDYAEREG